MTMVSSGTLHWPRKLLRPSGGSSGLSFSGLSGGTLTLDSTTDAVAWVGKSPLTDTLTTVYFRTGTIAASGGDTVDVRIETVSGGRPTGSLFGTDTNITVAVADTDDNVWKTATLTGAASLSAGDEFAIVVISSAGTPTITLYASSPNFHLNQYPIILQNATGAYAAPATNTGSLPFIVQFGTAGVVGLQNLLPLDGDPAVTNIGNGNERAAKFQVPYKCRVTGFGVVMGNFAANSGFTGSIWPASSTTDADALGQITLDGDFPYSTSDDGFVEFHLDAAVTLSKDTTYYMGVRQDTAANGAHYSCTSPSGITNSMRGFFLPTNNFHLATRTWTAGSAGAWTDAANTHPFMYLIIDQVDDGTGTGSGTTIAGTPMMRGMVS